MATYIIEIETDNLDDTASLEVMNDLIATLINRLFSMPVYERVTVSAAYKLDDDASTICSEGDLIYP